MLLRSRRCIRPLARNVAALGAVLALALRGSVALAATPTPSAAGLLRPSRPGALAAPPVQPPPPTAAAPVGAGLPTPAAGVLRPIGGSGSPTLRPGAADAAVAPATPTAPVPGPSPTPTEPPPTQTPTPVVFPELIPSGDAVRGRAEGSRLLLEVPIRSQFDGTEYQASNCGPTALAMVLDAFGVSARTFALRNLANTLQGTYDRDTGIALDYLAEIADQAGLVTVGLRSAGGYRRWSVEDVRDQVRRGHPVITLVTMRELPYFAGIASQSEHYVVVVGLDGDRLLVNDPAMPGAGGLRLPITAAELERAWDASSIPRHAAAFAAGERVRELDLPDPATSPTPTPVPHMEPTATAPVPPTAEVAAATPTALDPAPPPESSDGALPPSPTAEPARPPSGTLALEPAPPPPSVTEPASELAAPARRLAEPAPSLLARLVAWVRAALARPFWANAGLLQPRFHRHFDATTPHLVAPAGSEDPRLEPGRG